MRRLQLPGRSIVTDAKSLFPAVNEVITALQNLSESRGRSTLVVTTPVLAMGGSAYVELDLGATYRLLRVSVSGDARVRLYGTAAGQVADLTRMFGIGAAAGNFVHYDQQFQAGAGSLIRSDVIHGCNLEAIPTYKISGTVNNLSVVPSAITLTIISERLEY